MLFRFQHDLARKHTLVMIRQRRFPQQNRRAVYWPSACFSLVVNSIVEFKIIMNKKTDTCPFTKHNYFDQAYVINERMNVFLLFNLRLELEIQTMSKQETYQCCCHDIFFSLRVCIALSNWRWLVGIEKHVQINAQSE